MTLMWIILCAAFAYLLGSVPMGYVYVRVFTGQDIRTVGSGRTGGTNALRAAGLWVGLLTAFSDIMKGAVPVWVAQAVVAGSQQPLAMVAAGLAAILGHNYSIFMKFKGGAGGATAVGGALAFWPLGALIFIPLGAGILYFVGYASVATISAGITITLIFAYRALVQQAPGAAAEFIVYGLGATLLLAWTLRPNFRRLLRGEERLVGLRAKLRERRAAQSTPKS